MVFMPRHFPPGSPARCLLQGVHGLLSVVLLGVLPRSSTVDLFYKVKKVIKLTDSGLNPGADGGPPISVTGLNDAGSFVGYFPGADNNKLHAFRWDNGGQESIDLNAFLNADSSMATYLDEYGLVFGIYWPNDGTYIPGGFFYVGGGEMHTFASPAGSYGIQAVSRRGNCYDNARMESFWATLKTECFAGERPPTRQAAKLQIFDCVEGFYNRTRLHSSLGYQSPLVFENNLRYSKN